MEMQPFEQQNQPVIKTSDWFLTILISAIPLVGLIMLFVWSFGSGYNPNKANWAKATLIWVLIVIIIYILLFALLGFSFLKGMYS